MKKPQMSLKIKMAYATALGRQHEKDGLECQDYARSSKGRTVSVIVLADGASSAKYALQGAKSSAEGLIKFICANFHALLEESEDVIAEQVIIRLHKILERKAVELDSSMKHFASTLLFVASDGDMYICGQIGDGRMARYTKDLAEAELVFDPFKGEFLNETTFLSSDNALDNLELEIAPVENIGGFAILSDGAEESLYNRKESKFAPALGRMISWLDENSEIKVKQGIESNLSGLLREKTLDDLGLAVMRFI